MLRGLIICALFAVALCHDDSGESHEIVVENRGHCPVVSSNVSAAACATPCPAGTNCTFLNCSSDADCTGAQKCCETGCGLECVDPEFKSVCADDVDCPGTLICCNKSCVTVCKMQKPSKEDEETHKERKEEKEWD